MTPATEMEATPSKGPCVNMWARKTPHEYGKPGDASQSTSDSWTFMEILAPRYNLEDAGAKEEQPST